MRPQGAIGVVDAREGPVVWGQAAGSSTLSGIFSPSLWDPSLISGQAQQGGRGGGWRQTGESCPSQREAWQQCPGWPALEPAAWGQYRWLGGNKH